MLKQKKEKKVRKVRDIPNEVKKFEVKHNNDSKLENEIGESNSQNFTRFVKSSSGNVVPVLESGQAEPQAPAPVPTRRQAVSQVSDNSRSPYSPTPQSFYFTSTAATESERARLYRPITEVNSAPTLRPGRTIQPQQNLQQKNILEAERGRVEEDDRKYKGATERGRDKDKPKYDWE